ncbi:MULTISPECIES: dTDP-4-dehydrorhamnose reductase [Actinomadura]|uniref:dTDP-4-dehydrorhamnose reductase n=1 Tax=Actinomadura yumaensis TaxID=111807 RepID=A0ABW2CGA4_9ACTN|nr:dTDP-4-dehydrorhamnose reductase [Actinomadura sp. J1-007]MWK35649.1 dTDP-4-dehydrorhamnose reductase [Actinomadura sp. J1-007]
MRVYVTGANGMLGSALLRALPSGWAALGVSREDFDISDADAVAKSIEAFAPAVVVHAAANAIVDDCEHRPADAFRVNLRGTRNVAAACRQAGSRLVFISSDYVFDGAAAPTGGYRETDLPNPLSVYGVTKLAGERISAAVEGHLSVRTSWLFGGRDEITDQVLALVRRVERGERVRLIDDQFSAPTYTEDLARALVFLLQRRVTGTVHVANRGRASWYQVAGVALGPGHRNRAEPMPLDECGFRGERPRDSTLATDRLDALGFTMPTWQDAVRRFTGRLPAGHH